MDITKVERQATPAPEVASLLPLTPAVFHILLALATGASHGYAIMTEVEAITGGQMRLGPGTLYRSIQRMVLDGLLVERREAGAASAPDDERRRRYALTRLGQQVAQAESVRLADLVRAAQARGLLAASRTRR